jgi:NAD(P)-dependent dehydrogenase (short-subunit alcohol dehydrogenase family)
MNTHQHKIGSGFGHRTTAAEVLHGIDLTGRTALVTGGYSGLGAETTQALAAAGAHVIVPARRPAEARAALAAEVAAAQAATAAGTAEVAALDLGDLGSVRRFAEDFLASGRGLDIVIGNAGIMACPETRVGPGWEAHFAVNHLGHHALVNLLWPAINPGARVVMVSSAGHQLSGMRWDDVQFERGYDRWLAYAQAKTANALFAVHLDTLGRNRGVRAFSVHPGAILTPLLRHLTRAEMVERGWVDEDGRLADPEFKTPEQGAATQVWAATSPQLTGLGGLYCEDCDVAEPTDRSDMVAGVREHAVDPGEAERLWALSAELTGVNAFRM